MNRRNFFFGGLLNKNPAFFLNCSGKARWPIVCFVRPFSKKTRGLSKVYGYISLEKNPLSLPPKNILYGKKPGNRRVTGKGKNH